MPVQCNIINLLGLFLNITKIVIVGCRQLKIFKKTTRFRVFNSQGTQNTKSDMFERNSSWMKNLF